MTARRYRPARAGTAIVMPDRNNSILPPDGACVDIDKPYYRRLRDDGDIVPAGKPTARPARKRRHNSK